MKRKFFGRVPSQSEKAVDDLTMENRKRLFEHVAEVFSSEIAKRPHLTSSDVAKRMGYATGQMVYRTLGGNHNARLSTLADYAAALGKRVKVVLVDADDPKVPDGTDKG